MTAADAPSSYEFCVFDFPGCNGCPKALHMVRTVGNSEDLIKSEALRTLPRPKTIVFRSNQGGQLMEKFIHEENLGPVQETSR